ncbi:hypothetical protein [Immundisolibacter sp.]
MNEEAIELLRGRGNVFADLGDVRQLKAALAAKIIIDSRWGAV